MTYLKDPKVEFQYTDGNILVVDREKIAIYTQDAGFVGSGPSIIELIEQLKKQEPFVILKQAGSDKGIETIINTINIRTISPRDK